MSGALCTGGTWSRSSSVHAWGTLGTTPARVRPLLFCVPGFDPQSEGCRTVDVAIEWGAKRSVKSDNSTLPAQLYWLPLRGFAALPPSTVIKLHSIPSTIYPYPHHALRRGSIPGPTAPSMGGERCRTHICSFHPVHHRQLVATKYTGPTMWSLTPECSDLTICHV